MIEEYQGLKNQYLKEYGLYEKQTKIIAACRLIVAIILTIFIYKLFRTYSGLFLFGSILMFVILIVLIKTHKSLSWKKKIKKNLIRINTDEIAFLKGEDVPFESGEEYVDYNHFYSYDLDIFGSNSLFQHLNRTATYTGHKKLSTRLTKLLPNEEIILNQEAIKELSTQVYWRQYVLSLARIAADSKLNYLKLIDWAGLNQGITHQALVFLFYLFPVLFISNVILVFFVANAIMWYTLLTIFIINLILAFTQYRRIQKEIFDSDKISEILKHYGFILESIEKKKFESTKLNTLKATLSYKDGAVSVQIKKLASLFSNMHNIQNGIGAILFNGALLYHVHTLIALLNWKRRHSKHIEGWLDIIGEIEMLNSLAHFSYNNPAYAFPVLNEHFEVKMHDLGHPLIKQNDRVCNHVIFNQTNFTILTGSNMSGKSTFLRALGINMILTGTGSPICATKAHIHPLQVLVSMRQKDSLIENESYFFAEIKRLKQIIERLQHEICFVLLDEILKGTNSDDKHTGTIEVIKKIISKDAIGAIATHDLKVCQTTNIYPNKLVNKCFEVEIIKDQLFFDFKLRDGICKNKSATFLMKKLEIIPHDS